MANAIATILASVVIAVVLSAGIAFVALPTVYPVLESKTTEQKGTVQTVLKKWQDESYIYDNDLSWKTMNQTQMSFTIKDNSSILAQFSAPFLLTVDAQFTGNLYFAVSLVIQSSKNVVVGNTTTPIVYYNGAPASGYYHQLTYNPTLALMTNKLSAGTYNCSVQWRSLVDATGTINTLSVSHHNINSVYHYDRWMLLQEIQS